MEKHVLKNWFKKKKKRQVGTSVSFLFYNVFIDDTNDPEGLQVFRTGLQFRMILAN